MRNISKIFQTVLAVLCSQLCNAVSGEELTVLLPEMSAGGVGDVRVWINHKKID